MKKLDLSPIMETYPEAYSGIHIKPENRGKFNATKKRTGKTTEELTHSKNPLTRKRAIFAQNASHWNHGDSGMHLETLGNYALPAISLIDAAIPEKLPDTNLNNFPKQELYNPHLYGTGSQAIYKNGGEIPMYPVGGEVPPNKKLSDDQIMQSYLEQFKGDKDGPRKAVMTYLASKYNVPTKNIFTSSNLAYGTDLPRYTDYTVIGNDGKELITLRQPIGGNAVGAGSTGGNRGSNEPVSVKSESMAVNFENGGGLSRSKDYKSKKKPYPSVNSSDFAGPHRSFPIPTKQDGIDALRLAGLHHNEAVKSKVYAKYPELRKANSGTSVPYEEGKSYDLTKEQINSLIAQGYKIEY